MTHICSRLKPPTRKDKQFLKAVMANPTQESARQFSLMTQQEYKWIGGKWWMFVLGKKVRTLQPHEVAWHTGRNHAPFVKGGYKLKDPRW